jgi:hypothetical protein
MCGDRPGAYHPSDQPNASSIYLHSCANASETDGGCTSFHGGIHVMVGARPTGRLINRLCLQLLSTCMLTQAGRMHGCASCRGGLCAGVTRAT